VDTSAGSSPQNLKIEKNLLFSQNVLQGASPIKFSIFKFDFNTLICASISSRIRYSRRSPSFLENKLDLFASWSLNPEPRFLVVQISDTIIIAKACCEGLARIRCSGLKNKFKVKKFYVNLKCDTDVRIFCAWISDGTIRSTETTTA
jgi:hypothetical protein